jgi:hypothetical protein
MAVVIHPLNKVESADLAVTPATKYSKRRSCLLLLISTLSHSIPYNTLTVLSGTDPKILS